MCRFVYERKVRREKKQFVYDQKKIGNLVLDSYSIDIESQICSLGDDVECAHKNPFYFYCLLFFFSLSLLFLCCARGNSSWRVFPSIFFETKKICCEIMPCTRQFANNKMNRTERQRHWWQWQCAFLWLSITLNRQYSVEQVDYINEQRFFSKTTPWW